MSLFSSPPLLFFKKGLCKLPNHVPKRGTPITPEQLKLILTFLKAMGYKAAVYIAALVISYCTLARRSNVVVEGVSELGDLTCFWLPMCRLHLKDC